MNDQPRILVADALADLTEQPFETLLARLDQLEGRDRQFARNLFLSTLRHAGQADALIARYVERPLKGKLAGLQQLLRIGVVQLIWLDVPAHAAIHSTVELTKALGFTDQSGLVNAVLKKISMAGKEDLPPASANIPTWLYKRWEAAYKKDGALAMAEALLTPPPLDICAPSEMREWAARLGGEVLMGHAIRCQSRSVTELPGYDEGAWWVQDMAAQLPVLLLGDVAGKDILDMCAAPGGKTAQLIAAGAYVTALDRSDHRMQRLEDNMQRLGFRPEIIVADALEWQPGRLYDAILLDAPCSATGTARRHPDLLQRRKPHDVAEMVSLQQQLLTRATEWLKPGGLLIYCVCSLEPQEGEAQMGWVAKNLPSLVIEPIDPLAHQLPPHWFTSKGMLRTRPDFLGEKGGMDGFFAARLRRV